jgi:hypothetical protein
MSTVVALGGQQPHRPLVRLAVGIAVVGIVVGVGFAAYSLYQAWRAPDSFDRSQIGGALTVRLEAGQRVVVYDESGRTHGLGELALGVTSPTGETIPVEPYRGILEYDRSDVVARALGAFRATAGGSYQIRSSGPASGALAVGPDLVDVGVDGAERGLQIAAVVLVVAFAVGALGRSTPATSLIRPRD